MASDVTPINNNPIRPVKAPGSPVQPTTGTQQGASFHDLLISKFSPGIKFSGHALERLQKRNIALTPETLSQLNSAVQKAEEKGSKDSLVVMKDLAFIVSIKNHTVITAIDGEHIKENVFTNIDSAVIL